MKKYKVLKDFYDKHTGKLNAEGKTIELSDERAEEIRENLAAYGGFIKEVGVKKSGKDKEADKTDEIGEANGENEKDNAANDVEADKKEKEAE